ncbi:sulfur transfer protein [Synechococcus sp. KORDI-52]|uniref:sulfur carrier protein ThiS n=1 Tax=Synechococcus sp. KORDI-52 TaxID=585425 RepID=UPI0004E0A4EB|nr:sulfur carrier protein ThiS [Synechococcus sp. KORDI-52]AII49939.1 sulfur transfer protein [Synechococcus sp. KORDI-52]
MPLTLMVNGETRVLDPAPEPTNLAAVVALLANNPQLVVAEHNGVIAPRSRWEAILVKDDDTLEIVTIVGGGS